jgi:hypothetical protein
MDFDISLNIRIPARLTGPFFCVTYFKLRTEKKFSLSIPFLLLRTVLNYKHHGAIISILLRRNVQEIVCVRDPSAGKLINAAEVQMSLRLVRGLVYFQTYPQSQLSVRLTYYILLRSHSNCTF